MRDSAFDPPQLTAAFWSRADVCRALDRRDIAALFRLLKQHAQISQIRIGTAVALSQGRVSRITRGLGEVTTRHVLARIASGLDMPDHARARLGLSPSQAPPPRPPAVRQEDHLGEAAELLRRISSARYIDASVIGVLQDETDAIRLLDRRLGAPAVAAKLDAHIAQLRDSLRHSITPGRRERLAAVLADAAALAGWQAIDTGRLADAWDHFETATAAAREAADPALLAFASAEQGYVLLDLSQPARALEKVRAARARARTSIPQLLSGWLYAAEAEMAAAAGDKDTCHTALDLAAEEIDRSPADALPYLALDTAHLARWRGNCLVQFGDTATIRDLTGALAAMDGTFTRAEAGLQCDLAAAFHAAGERREARRHLRRATELAQLTGSARQRRRVTILARSIRLAA